MADETLSFSPARTKAEARAMGLKRYFTGKPCKHGHIAERYVSDPNCIECMRLRAAKAGDREREYHREYNKRYNADPAKVEKRRAQERRRYAKKRGPQVVLTTAIDDAGVVRPIVSRAQAEASGLPRYFTGKPCKYGHAVERSTATSHCLECLRGPSMAGGRREYHRNYQKIYYADPLHRARRRELGRDRRKTPHHRAVRRQNRTNKRVALAGRPKPHTCEVCKVGRKIHFDHCHATGKFRGWICDSCNLALGMVRDDYHLLRALADYVQRHVEAHPQLNWIEKTETERILEKL